MLSGKNIATGTLIMVIGVCFIIFVLAKLLPTVKKDADGRALSWIFGAVAVAITAMGGWIFVS